VKLRRGKFRGERTGRLSQLYATHKLVFVAKTRPAPHAEPSPSHDSKQPRTTPSRNAHLLPLLGLAPQLPPVEPGLALGVGLGRLQPRPQEVALLEGLACSKLGGFRVMMIKVGLVAGDRGSGANDG
jgi:hypothetical protein